MKAGWKSLAWSAAALVLLLSLATPFSVITLFLLMVPFVVLFTALKPGAFVLHLIPVFVLAFLLLGGYGAIAATLGFFFLIPSIAMGYRYKKGASARSALVLGSIVILAQLLIEFTIFSIQFKLDLAAELASAMDTMLQRLQTGTLLPSNWTSDMADSIVKGLPMLLLLSSFLFALIAHGLSRWALRSFGIQANALPEARTWRLPRSLVFYYLIALVASFFISADATGFWPVVVSNLVPLLQYAFIAQAIGFFFFLAHEKQWPKAVPILIAIPLILFPPLYLIGLIDAVFPLRRYFVKE
ncbi:DUF2232 domain-containing protein [Cohnella faecalis]|uniref:DUF2232 domain-containing protein n=1 Tax=Cohnella faecalis TaxID=2315694 RepID=UPI001314BE15|nr:DUF2232 domain-containing protein [Cohnella faecalis]